MLLNTIYLKRCFLGDKFLESIIGFNGTEVELQNLQIVSLQIIT